MGRCGQNSNHLLAGNVNFLVDPALTLIKGFSHRFLGGDSFYGAREAKHPDFPSVNGSTSGFTTRFRPSSAVAGKESSSASRFAETAGGTMASCAAV
ncbi:hypothetical protein AMTR_s00055p00185650 [Amborella trichopoda]|uniref:Uncharacterized protein n=1 Tax=Amborella trichopoda TaxID=13333 RepID=U5DA67_AMBTC|nr:hypothetical protein AMTR_s00055p00185650 [Amborella trichopoda]